MAAILKVLHERLPDAEIVLLTPPAVYLRLLAFSARMK